MDRLLEIGFQYVGRWKLQGNALALELDRMSTQRNVLYAFIVDQSVLYIGKTTGTLEARMSGYLRPHSTQRTNVRNNYALIQMLRQGKLVEIYAWMDAGLHKVGVFHLNYAAGLEDSIIKTLCPPWNGARSQPGVTANALPVDTPPTSSTTTKLEPAEITPIPNDSEAASDAEVKELRASAILNPLPSFQVKLGKTYFNRGFFNVPVKYAGLFPGHGTELIIYCGSTRTLVRAIVDRNANQGSGTPRIYGKNPLAAWFSRNCNLDDEVTIRVISFNEIELS
jgi:hypothetical protein